MTMHPSPDRSTPDFPSWDHNTVQRLAAEYCKLGDTLFASQDYLQARSVYQIAIDYSPHLAIAHEGIARAEYHLSKSSAPNLEDLQLDEVEFDRLALANFDLYIAAHPQDPDGYYYRGMYYEQLAQNLIALADFDRAISLARLSEQSGETTN
jgi:tetratricopeptide (TPR) repeat protein